MILGKTIKELNCKIYQNNGILERICEWEENPGLAMTRWRQEYAKYLKSIANDEKKLYKMFSAQVFALGLINQRKNNSLRKSMVFFVTALVSELLIIMYLAYLRAYSYLDDRIYQFVYGIIIVSVIAITFTRYDVITKIRKSLNI